MNERIETEPCREEHIDRLGIDLVAGFQNDVSSRAGVRPPPNSFIGQLVTCFSYSHPRPGIRQTVRKASAQYGEQAGRIKREEPNARMSVRRSHVRTAIRFR